MSESVVKSARRVMEIFEYLADRQKPATLMEVARELGYPASSTSALLKSLQSLGYLDYDPQDRTFVPTLRTALLGIWVNDAMLSDSTILQMMRELRDRTGGTVILGAQTGLQIQILHVVRTFGWAQPSPISSGCRRPLLRSAMGHVILSLKTEREVIAVTRRLNAEERNSENWVHPRTLLPQLERCRREGYAYTEGATTPTGGMVAALLAAPQHQLPMALGVGAPLALLREKKEHFVTALREVVSRHREPMEKEWRARYHTPVEARPQESSRFVRG